MLITIFMSITIYMFITISIFITISLLTIDIENFNIHFLFALNGFSITQDCLFFHDRIFCKLVKEMLVGLDYYHKSMNLFPSP